MGLWGAAQAIAFAAGGVLGTAAVDIARQFFPDAAYAYGIVFAAEAIVFLWAAVIAGELARESRESRRSPSPTVRRQPSIRTRDGRMNDTTHTFDVVVVGGGPSGSTAANDLARMGRSVLLLDRAGRIKPCGGAVPPRLVKDFDIPDSLIVARINSARMISPADRRVDMPIDGGYVGMVNRETFDEWLRERAALGGATRVTGTFLRVTRDAAGAATVHYRYDPTVSAR